MKKIISALLSVVMMMSVFSVGAYAVVSEPSIGGAMPMYDSGDVIRASLVISNKTAECTSTVILCFGEKLVKITQTLQKQTSSGSWDSTSNSWTKTAFSSSSKCTFSNSANLTEGGNYRLKSVVVIELSSGKQETVTKYSSIVSV